MATAKEIIERCGGHRTVAEWLGISRSGVQRWTYEHPNGCGNWIPAKNWPALIAAAKLNGIDIRAEELIPPAARAAEALAFRRQSAA